MRKCLLSLAFLTTLASVAKATGPTLPPPVDENLKVQATGPTLPPPVDEN